MDANGLRFWMLSAEPDWTLDADTTTGAAGVQYCRDERRLQLRSTPDAPMTAEVFADVASLLDAPPFARDQFGTYAHVASGHIMAGGAGPADAGEVPIFTPSGSAAVTDLVLGYDGVLYIAVGGQLVFCDRRNRWADFTMPGTFTAWRLAAHPAGGVIVLDREHHQLLRVQGLPLPDLPPIEYAAGVMRPCDDNPDPPRVSATLTLPDSEYYVAIAGDGQRQFALLSWAENAADNDQVSLRTFTSLVAIDAVRSLTGPRFPYSMAWLESGRIAVIASRNRKAFIFDTSVDASRLDPTGDSYVLADTNTGPFAHGFDQPPYYNLGDSLYPLVPLSLNSLARSGTARNTLTIDSGASRTVWHRLYLEAVLPPRCGAVVWLTASDDPSKLGDPATTGFPHLFGDVDAPAGFSDVPRGVWQRTPSEVPFHPGLVGEPPQPNRSGLFMTLVQRADRVVRSLRGRYLGISVVLTGDGRSTPEIAALRVYGPRFSYVEHYLPEIYRESTFGPQADLTGASTGADWFERFVDIFEAPMTQFEDRIAAAHLLTNPRSTPDDGIDWLGSWIGVDPDPMPPGRRRARLVATPKLYAERGTVQAIADAVDVATDGLCQRGAVILVEDYRLRHTFATILGADLRITDDPLLPGTWESSNSYVGDTLFLGDEHKKEFLALYADAIQTAQEQARVDAFYENLANRLTVFIHDQVETVDQQVVQRVVEREKPAHVGVTYMRASQAFIVGMASLVGVNSYLAPDPPREIARVGESTIGRHAFIAHLPSLDPRVEDTAGAADFALPIARITGPAAVGVGTPFTLDASASSAPEGHTITNFHWTIVSGPN